MQRCIWHEIIATEQDENGKYLNKVSSQNPNQKFSLSIHICIHASRYSCINHRQSRECRPYAKYASKLNTKTFNTTVAFVNMIWCEMSEECMHTLKCMYVCMCVSDGWWLWQKSNVKSESGYCQYNWHSFDISQWQPGNKTAI